MRRVVEESLDLSSKLCFHGAALTYILFNSYICRSSKFFYLELYEPVEVLVERGRAHFSELIFVVGPLTFEVSLCVSQAFMSVSLLWSGHVHGDLFLEFERIKPPSLVRSWLGLPLVKSCQAPDI